jgi:cation:H+ antiporter
VEWAGKRFELSEGCAGSVLAALGKALPEMVIPIIAIFFTPSGENSKIGRRRHPQSAVVLATLELFICGLSVLIFRKKRGNTSCMSTRDWCAGTYVLPWCLLAGGGGSLPPIGHGMEKYTIGASLIPIYIILVWYTVRHGQNCAENKVEALYCDRIKGKYFGRTGEEIECLPGCRCSSCR